MKNPEKNNIHETFDGSVRYSAPVYQRYYVWGYEELQALLDDIENAASENSEQFIGATVVQDFGKKGGNQSPNEYLIIDGQQRLTTIYLLICGLSWAYLKGGRTENATTLTQTYLSFSAGKYAGMPKLLPTIQDRKQLFDILQEEITCIEWKTNGENSDETSRRQGISSQWKNIKKHFTESFFDESEKILIDKIESFQEQMLNYVVYVQITLETKDDANTAFSKLNYDGITLSIADLVRNDVFSRLEENKKESLDKFYEKTWKPFEKSFPGNSFEQYITIYSFIKFKGTISKARSFPDLQKSWEKMKPTAIINEMKTYADLYSVLVEYDPIKGIHNDVNERIRRLSLMPKTTVTWPYILELLNAFRSNNISKKQALDCLSIVESFLVRRAIAGLEPTGLHSVFKSLWQKAGADSIKLREKIVTSTIRCPNDNQIREVLSNENMYARQITKYLLIQREIDFNKAHGYDNATNDFSVEHVLPRNHAGQWALQFTKEEHATLLNTIGNLVPLTKGQNTKIKDFDWDKKKPHFKGSNWKMTQRLSGINEWNKPQILKQTKEFTTWALSEWPDIT
jgi:uncharacterized protein with ParB-like and HNH nuclease domain